MAPLVLLEPVLSLARQLLCVAGLSAWLLGCLGWLRVRRRCGCRGGAGADAVQGPLREAACVPHAAAVHM